jgi:hypothetical protein
MPFLRVLGRHVHHFRRISLATRRVEADPDVGELNGIPDVAADLRGDLFDPVDRADRCSGFSWQQCRACYSLPRIDCLLGAGRYSLRLSPASRQAPCLQKVCLPKVPALSRPQLSLWHFLSRKADR